MNPLLKGIAIAVAALLLLAGGAALLLRLLVDEAALEARLLDFVNSRIDGTLAIDGGTSLSLWPSLALRVGDLRLRTPRTASTDFASARELRIGVALLPLLREELHVNELLIDGLTLDTSCEAGERCNWTALGAGTTSTQPAAPAQATGGPAAAAMPLGIARLEIRDARLVYTDRKDGSRFELARLQLDGEGFNTRGEPFRLQGTGELAFGEPRRAVALALELPEAAIDLDAGTLKAPSLALEATGLSLDGSLEADWSKAGASTTRGRLALERLDLPSLLQALGKSLPPTLNAEALQDIVLSADYTLAGERLALEELTLRAGRFTAEGRVALGSGGTGRIEAELSSPELDLDYFLPPPEIPPGDAEEPAPPGPGTAGDTPPPDALRVPEGEIRARLGRLKKGGLELGELTAQLAFGAGAARLQSLDATLYGGTLHAAGAVATGTGPGSMRLDATLAGVDLKALLGATSEVRNLEGRVSGSLALTARGNTAADWERTLGGPVQFQVVEPLLREVSIEEIVCKASATLNQEELSARFEPLTRFRNFDAALDFAEGIGTIRRLDAAVPNMSLRGEGRIDLPRDRFRIQFNTRITDDLASRDRACRMTKKMLALEWPVTCSARFEEKPKDWCGIDRDDLAKIATQLATEKVQDKFMKKLGDFLGRD